MFSLIGTLLGGLTHTTFRKAVTFDAVYGLEKTRGRTVTIGIDANPLDPSLPSRLRSIRDSLSNFSDEMTDASEFVKGYLEGPVFDSEGEVYGKKWDDLSPKYEAWKMFAAPGKGILELSGDMRASFEYEISPHQAYVTNPTPYLEQHQLGENGVPVRPIFYVNQEMNDSVFQVFVDGVQKRVDAGGMVSSEAPSLELGL